jgi:CubicO group peptidase (beta-lactamase class C family)
VAVGLVVGDQAVISCEGVTSVDDPLPVTPETLFQVGSVTKSFTAAAALAILAAQGVDLSGCVISGSAVVTASARPAT